MMRQLMHGKRIWGLLIILMMASISAFAQQKNITGTIIGDDNLPIPGATIVVKGTSNGTISSIDGKYSIKANEGDLLQFSFVGMETQEVKVTNLNTINIELKSATIGMDEVVVTALGIKREKKSLGYSVQEVKGDELSRVKDANVVNSLSGKIAGVTISPSSTGTGGGSRIVIRGNNSISGNNEPLVVVDGVPITDNSSNTDDRWGNRAIDRGDGIADINPDDIATMSVLKGPAAAALYGSRAANGVILITTKSGTKTDRVKVSLSSNVVFESPLTQLDLQNEYGQGTGGAFVERSGASWGPKMEGQMIKDWTGESRSFSPYDNNLTDFLETGVNMTNNIDVTAGSEKVKFRAGFSRMDYWGQLPNNKLNRNTLNLRSTIDFSPKLSLDLKFNYIKSKGENRPKLAGDPDNVYFNMALMPRSIHLSDMKDYRNDDLTVRRYSDNGGMILNPYWTVNMNTNWDDKNRVIAMASLNYKFADWLTAKLRYGTDYTTVRGYDQLGTGVPYWQPTGDVKQDVSTLREDNTDFLLTASKTELISKLSANLSVGGNIMRQNNMSTTQWANGLITPDFYSINNGKAPRTVTNYYEKGINSLYGMGQLSWDNYLFVDLTARNDWSSTLPSDNRSYFYASAGLGWVLSEMVTLPEWINFLKVRGSWAQVGNDTDSYKLDQYLTIDLIGESGVPGATLPSDLPASNLKPEQATSYEVGAEGRLFNDRLGFDLTYYKVNTKDQILALPTPPATGYVNQFINAGNIENRGVELMIRGTLIKNENFQWDMTLNWAKNTNKVIDLYDGIDTYVISPSTSQVSVITNEGGSYGDLQGTHYVRDDQGRKVLDAEGLPVISQDRSVIGNYLPDWTAGLSNTFVYKNLSIGLLFDIRKGGDIYSGSVNAAAAAGTLAETSEGRDAWYNGTGGYVVSGVDVDGNAVTKTVNPESYWSRVSGIDEEWIYDATNIRLRELSVGYSLPKTILSGTPFTGAQVSFVGRNLWLIYSELPGLDPESSYSQSNAQGLELGAVSTPRTLGFNIKLDF
ncbi:SusC/RagA family TonB-linked outer membrane protein [Halosquirtibacter laminarini]|uniref:SusC/RagA family TonB-linked outer membrane protein n=1 Tax=Halosquirtibacter laminarini TaxID=3374600 RepID=A0AC61NL10_9BACT|nr:SusC/RagA family TonB-linked outer membrane protein [Prolixibacteraceae bacterium]